MFQSISNSVFKGKVKGLLLKKLDQLKEIGGFDHDPMRVSHALVDSLWDDMAARLRSARPRPSVELVVILALGNGLQRRFNFGRDRKGVLILFLQEMSSYAENAKPNPSDNNIAPIAIGITKYLKPEIEEVRKEMEELSADIHNL